MDWRAALHAIVGDDGGQLSLAQMSVRAVIIFAIGVALVRFSAPRAFSKATPLDIILSVIIGSNLSRTLTGNAPFLKVLAVTVLLVALHSGLRHLTLRFRLVADLVKGRPLALVRGGRIDERAMADAAVGRRELMAAIRDAGATEVEAVELAILERSGDIAVVLR